MARATVYRRWATKTDLVLEAVSRMSHGDVNLDQLPDTGSLRGDMTAMIVPFDDEQQQVRIHAMACSPWPRPTRVWPKPRPAQASARGSKPTAS